MLFGVVADGVLVPAQNVDRIPADSQPWSRDFAAINRVPDGGVGGSSAFGSHIPLSRVTSHRDAPGGGGTADCSLWQGFLNSRQVFRPGGGKKLDVLGNSYGPRR